MREVYGAVQGRAASVLGQVREGLVGSETQHCEGALETSPYARSVNGAEEIVMSRCMCGRRS